MKRGLFAIAALAVPVLCSAQAMTGTVEFPCKLTSYRIMAKDKLAVLCDGVRLERLEADFALYKLVDESVNYPAAAHPKPGGAAARLERFWLVFVFDREMAPDQKYEVRFSGTFGIKRPGESTQTAEHFSATRFRFSTSPELALATARGRNVLFVESNVALQQSDSGKLIDHSNQDKIYTLSAGSPEPDDYDAAGRILLMPAPAPASLGKELELQGVTDIFGRPVKLKPYKPAPPPAAPKSKDAAAWYFNFLHQAGVGIKPTWIANFKAAPVLGALPGNLFFAPCLNVDVGNGQVGQTKTTDLINPKLGLSGLFRTNAAPLNAVKFTPSLSYETNREGTKRNLLFDGDMRLYFQGLSNTKAARTLDAFWRERRKNPKVLPQDVSKAVFGYDIQFYAGAEIGNSLTGNSVKSSDKSSQVVVPAYAIRRLRPHSSATFEFWNVTVSLAVFPRYLFDPENVTRESDTVQPNGSVTKTIRLSTVAHWRPYGECSISYAFDPAGHYALNGTYKLGSQPPNFDRTNVVQSGFVVRF
jgi:hypothetical protein